MRFFLNILAAVLVLAASVLPLSCSTPEPVDNGSNKAAIVDQLYLRQPNPDFIAEATRLLESYGFEVDVWQGADITVDFYRKLASLGYKFIVLRVHSGLLVDMEGKPVFDTTFMFTAENYTSTRYVTDQLTDKISYAMMEENYPLVFAVNSEFMKRASGKFDRTVILAMGCESYKYDDLPLAFIEKGASVYMGWSDVVSLEHVDSVTLDLLHNLCTENMTLAEGISRSMADMGKDPYFGSYLKYYPSVSGNSTVWELIRQ